LLGLAAIGNLALAGDPPVQVYYFPLPEDEAYTSINTIYPGNAACNINVNAAYLPAEPMNGYNSVSIAADNTVIYFDHWEDGYEPDIANPIQASTETWGDGLFANGAPPGVTTDAADVLNAGTLIILEETTIDVDTLDTVIDYDGRDKIGSTEFVSATRALWASGSSTLLAGAFEMYDTTRWGTLYTVPVGEDLVSNQVFEYVGLTLMASEDATRVTIDSDADGNPDQTVVINEGDTFFVNGGLLVGASVSASAPIQVNYLTGDVCATYEARFYTPFPDDQWADTYHTPVDSNTDSSGNFAATHVWLFNPDAGDIDVTVENQFGTSIQTVPDNGTVGVQVASGSGTKFSTADNSLFYALSTIDSGTFSSSSSDWGFSLVPETQMYQQLLVGLGFGADPTTTSTANTSPVWLTGARVDDLAFEGAGLDVCIDYNGDNAGPLFDASIAWNYDLQVTLAAFESRLIFEPDNDQSGMYVFVCDTDSGDRTNGVISGVWGQDPTTAPGGSPAVDVGTTAANIQALLSDKA
jgi:hypothetical protein